MVVVRNANQQCLDEVPGDEHLAENNRKRCEEHHLKKKADTRLRSKAKQAGEDVSGWVYQKSKRLRPPAAVPKGQWAGLAEVHEDLYEASRPLFKAVKRGQPLAITDAAGLAEAINANINATQKLLYGPGLAPDDAAGPPSEAPTDVGRPGQREDLSQGKTPPA